MGQWGKVNRDHVLRSHIPFNASCEHCVRGRGLEPARRVEREEGEGAQKEVQVDKFQYKGLWFLVLVLVGCFAIGAVQYREVSGPRGNEARESMLADMSAWGRSVGLVGVDARDLSVCVRSDLEGVVRSLAQGFADGLTAGAVEVTDVPVGRHAPVAERAVRTLKESANTLCVGLEGVGLEPYGNGVTYLLKHCAQAHNRYGHRQGSALSPEQKALKSLKAPHPMYVWGAAVLATPTRQDNWSIWASRLFGTRSELPDGPGLEEELDYSPDYEPGEAVQPGAGAWSDEDVERGVELELREGELVEPSSLVEFEEDEEAMMEVEPEALDRVLREDAEGMMMSIEHREALSFAAVSPKEEIVELGGEKLVVEMPYSSVDNTNGGVLDVGLTYEGMLRELRALESLAVGDVIWEVDPKEKVISTRWVSNAKVERVDGKEHRLVRCRVVTL